MEVKYANPFPYPSVTVLFITAAEIVLNAYQINKCMMENAMKKHLNHVNFFRDFNVVYASLVIN